MKLITPPHPHTLLSTLIDFKVKDYIDYLIELNNVC